MTALRLLPAAAAGLIAIVQPLAVSAAGADTEAVAPWTIESRSSAGKRECTASSTFSTLPNPLVESSVRLTIGLDDVARLQFANDPRTIAPHFLVELRGNSRAEVLVRRAWFDRSKPFPIRLIDDFTAKQDIVLGNAATLLEALDGGRALTMETEPERQATGKHGERVTVPSAVTIWKFDNAPALAAALRACVSSLRRQDAFIPVSVPRVPASPEPGLPLKDEVEKRTAAIHVLSVTSPDSPALAMALLDQADSLGAAFRLKEALDAYQAGLRLASRHGVDAPRQALSRTKLAWLYLVLERIDDLEELARTLPDARRWAAAAAVMRGDKQAGENQFLRLLSELSGRPLSKLGDLRAWIDDADRPRSRAQLQPIRELLLLWAQAALGQELWISHAPVRKLLTTPSAAVIVDTFLSCLDPEMLRDDVVPSDLSRAMIGQAAFLRGESLRRAGKPATVASDLWFAARELDGAPKEEGWLARVRVARGALAADLGLDASEGFLANATRALNEIGSDFGETSLPWLEAASVLADIQLRTGHATEALALAARASEVASFALASGHSVTMKLGLLAAEASFVKGSFPEAGRLAARALGLGDVRPVAADKLDALARNPALATDVKKRMDTLGEALGARPPARLDRPVVERMQAERAIQLLLRIVRALPSPDDRATLLAIVEYTRAASMALRASDRADKRDRLMLLEDSLVNDLHQFLFRRPSEQLALSKLDLLTLDQRARDFLNPNLVIPADERPTLRYGDELKSLEYLLHNVHRAMEAAGTTPQDRLKDFDLGLNLASAASRGDASATVYGPYFSNLRGTDGLAGDIQKTRGAISTGLFTQRLRSQLLQEAAVGARRRLYLRTIEYSEYAGSVMLESFSTFASQMAAHYGRYSANAASFMSNLKAHQAVLVWLPLEASTCVFVVRPGSVAWHFIPQGRREIGRRIASIRNAIDAAGHAIKKGDTPLPASFPSDEARALYRTLFGPVEAELSGVTHVFTAQLGVVGRLPLHLLRIDNPETDSAPRWIGERFAITRMPGLLNPDLVFGNAPRSGGQRRLLAVGAPGPASIPVSNGLGAASILELEDLPKAAGEIARISSELGAAGNQSTVLQGQRATRAATLQALAASPYDVILFATHGLRIRDGVGESALLLAANARDEPVTDRLFYASDVALLRAQADLVILSACSTAAIDEETEEPLTGLATAFMAAGSRNVVASYWRIEDDVAPKLTASLVHARYSDRLDVGEALRRAIAQFRDSTGSSSALHPVVWASLEAIGLPWNKPDAADKPAPRGKSATPAPSAPPARSAMPAPPTPPARNPMPTPSAPPARNPAAPPSSSEASRLFVEGMAAADGGDCQTGYRRSESLFRLLKDAERRRDGAAQIQRQREAAAGVFMAARRCEARRSVRSR